MGGIIPRDTFQDAAQLLEEMDLNDSTWHDWPLIATDGDCAALIQLISDDKVGLLMDRRVIRSLIQYLSGRFQRRYNHSSGSPNST